MKFMLVFLLLLLVQLSSSFSIFYFNSSSPSIFSAKYGSIGSLPQSPILSNFTLLYLSDVGNDCTLTNKTLILKNKHVIFEADLYTNNLFKNCVSDYRANGIALAKLVEREGASGIAIWNFKTVYIFNGYPLFFNSLRD